MRQIPLVITALAISAASGLRGEELVIVNPASTATSVSHHQLAALYFGRKRSLANGEHVEILTLDGGPTHQAFMSNELSTTPDEFATAWKRLVFSGQGKSPESFASEADMVAYVAAHPGTIGYCDAATPHDGVKVLKIED